MITYLDTTPGPYVLGCIEVKHEGDPWPGTDRRHLLQACLQIASFNGIYGAAIFTTTLESAQALLAYLVDNPDVVQDCCIECRGSYRGPRHPRWNIEHDGHPQILVPCVIEDWM